MAATIYQVKYQGTYEKGGAVLYVGNGIISGMDVGGLTYDGTYSSAAGGGLTGTVTLTATTTGQLVTGAVLQAGQSVSLPLSLPASFGNGQQFQFNVGGSPVNASFHKIRDLP